MERNGTSLKVADLRGFDENRSRFPAEQLISYAGMHVAWSLDGTRIVASANTRAGLDQQLEAAGVELGQVVHDYIDPPLE